MSLSLLNLIIVVLTAVALSGAAWAIARDALEKTDEISDVVEALIETREAADRTGTGKSGGVNWGAFANGEKQLQRRFQRQQLSARGIGSANGLTVELADDGSGRDFAESERKRHDHQLSEFASP